MLIVIWQMASSLAGSEQHLFPAPLTVAQRLIEIAQDGLLWPSIRATMQRMIIGYAFAASMGIVLGAVMGVSSLARDCAHSLLLGMQTLPSAAWVPIGLLLFGLSDATVYFVIVLSSIGGIAVAVADGISNVSPLYLRAARSMGTSPWAMTYRVVLPAALPSIVTGLKLGWTLGWHGAVSAELIKSSIGLGFLLHMGRELNDAPQVVAIMLVTIAVGLLIDRLTFAPIEKQVRERWGLNR